MYDLQKFGRRMNLILKENETTMTQLAETLGVSRHTVARWMVVSPKSVPLGMLCRIADMFDVSIDWLSGECAEDER